MNALIACCRTELSGFYGNAFPERYASRDIARSILRLGVIPGGITIDLVVDDDVVITGRAFPAAHGVRIARLQVLAPDRISRKINVALDDLDCLAWRFRDR